jgi:heterodisulfide reductase subunit C
MGMESELLRDKDIIWQCVSCNKCTYACPRDVFPEGVMKATSHWLELKGHTGKSPSMHFDEVFTEQIVKNGKIEEGRTIRGFFSRTGQALFQDWLVEMVKRILRGLPVGMLTKMGLATFVAPRTSGWAAASEAMQEYIDEQHEIRADALNLAALAKRPDQDVAA